MLSNVLKLLPKLSKAELSTVELAIQELLKTKGTAGEPPLYAALGNAMQQCPPWGMFAKTNAALAFSRHAERAELFLKHHFPKAKKLDLHYLRTFTLRALIVDLKARDVPITVGTVTKNLGRFADVFEDQFPGYLQGGLAWLILRTLKRGEHDQGDQEVVEKAPTQNRR